MSVEAFDQVKLKAYYGTILSSTADLKTSACCTPGEGLSGTVRAALSQINDEVLARFYGCGSPIPPALEGQKVLDLGCGAGRDAFVASRLVGSAGRVIGVDMTPEQIDVARRNVTSQMARFGYARPNVEFRLGYIENLRALDIADASVDVVISNCVLNLSPDKRAVFSEIARVLKPGGELYFADVFSGRRVPGKFHTDAMLHGECLAGAMYREDFRRLMSDVGFADFRMVQSRRIALNSPEVEKMVGMIDFYSDTVRAFKLDLEDRCEDYGQIAIYSGTVPDWPHYFDLDDHHRFLTGKPMLVCGNTAAMVQNTRFRQHFVVHGDRSTHFGLFDCKPAAPGAGGASASGGACC